MRTWKLEIRIGNFPDFSLSKLSEVVWKFWYNIYNYKDILEYVIFVDGQYYEILLIADIPELVKNLPERVIFKDGHMKKRLTNIFANL